MTDEKTKKWNRIRAQEWREKNREKDRKYHREYMRRRRAGIKTGKVEVRRCGECKHWQTVETKHKCELHLSVTDANDFCSWAERKEEQ